MRLKKLLPLLLVVPLVSCNSETLYERKVYSFDTVIDIKLYEGNENHTLEIEKIINAYDALSDNYQTRSGVINLTSLNATNEETQVDQRLYTMLKKSFEVNEKGATYFNPLCGSLAKAWKNALSSKKALNNEEIAAELNKINTSSLSFLEDNTLKRSGEAELDLGGFVKGYVLDEIYGYLSFYGIKHYLINAGSSSILLGEKTSNDGYFNVGINSDIIAGRYLKLKNCFVSTSSVSVQGVQIAEGGPIYSHIINPITGSAINEHDAVIVVSSNGALGDALSTSMMMNTVEEIKEIENAQDVKCIVFDNHQVTYCNNDLEILAR